MLFLTLRFRFLDNHIWQDEGLHKHTAHVFPGIPKSVDVILDGVGVSLLSSDLLTAGPKGLTASFTTYRNPDEKSCPHRSTVTEKACAASCDASGLRLKAFTPAPSNGCLNTV
jgi:hypothetical protein